MTSEVRRTPRSDHSLTPENAAFIIIDYQPIQVASIRSLDRKERVFNIVSTARAAVNYDLPIVHSTANVASGRNQPPIPEVQAHPERDFKGRPGPAGQRAAAAGSPAPRPERASRVPGGC